MVSHSEIAQEFANGSEKANGSRMFIEGDTVYSYGHHFSIAKRYRDGFYLFNTNEYSSSTATHKHYVLGAISGGMRTVILIQGADETKATQTINEQTEKIEILKGKQKRARTENMKNIYKQEIKDLKYNIQLIKTNLSQFVDK